MRVALNHANVGALALPAAGQIDYFDSRQADGFGIRVSQAGTRTWFAMYRHGGKLRRAVLGHWPQMQLTEARKAARKIRSQADAGIDPGSADDADPDEHAAAPVMTVAGLAEVYLNHHARLNKRPTTVLADERMLRSMILPVLGARPIVDVRRSEIRLLLDGVAARGALVHANRIRALLSTMFNVAVDRELLEHNPVTAVKRPLKHEVSRERVLTDDEIRALWLALKDAAPQSEGMFRLLLLTGQRPGEVLGLPWAELDLDGGWWVLPGERAKNGKSHRIPLVPLAVATLRAFQGDDQGSPFVFPGRPRKPRFGIRAWVRDARDRAALENFRPHDCRRTVASGMARIGVPRLVISKILNHTDRSITRVYDRHSYDMEKRQALIRWERELLSIVSGEPRSGEVIELPRAS